MRLSIEVTNEEHQRIKAVASLQGKSLKEYVLERVLPETATPAEKRALSQLEKLLDTRVDSAKNERPKRITVTQIFKTAHKSAAK